VNGAGASFELDRVAVDFGSTRALDGVSLSVASGEAVAFIGPSGAGKTTLLRLINGSVRPTRGSLAVNRRALDALSPSELRRLRSSIGFIHQDLRLVPNVRVVKNVLAGRLGRLSLAGTVRAMLFPPRTFVAQAHALLERVGIPEKLFERTDRLSGGQQQRVAIARALFQEPVALLADEPVSSVDPARAHDTVALLTEICRERRLTLCVSLHDLELARRFFPRLVGLRHGRVAFDCTTRELREEAFHALYRLAPGEALADAR
jgi:phosphonate transport system ATP-binding protein